MFFLIHSLFSKKKRVQIALAYYTNLANSSIKEIQTRFFYSEAINYCDNNGQTEPKQSKHNLGVLYYNLNKYGDAKIFF
jgi:hypothetical protein